MELELLSLRRLLIFWDCCIERDPDLGPGILCTRDLDMPIHRFRANDAVHNHQAKAGTRLKRVFLREGMEELVLEELLADSFPGIEYSQFDLDMPRRRVATILCLTKRNMYVAPLIERVY